MSRYLLDTNVISETIQAKPNPVVIEWLSSVDISLSYLSVLTLGELRKGIERVTDSKRQHKLRHWLETTVIKAYQSRLLSIDHETAERWGYLMAKASRPLPGIDSLLTATALHHDMVLVTRNLKDFDVPGLELLNPWEF